MDGIQSEIRELRNALDEMKNNHLRHLEISVADIRVIVESLKNNVRWIMVIGGFIIMQSVAIIYKVFFN